MDADLGRWRSNGLLVVTSPPRTVRCLASSLFMVFSLLVERLTVTHTTAIYINVADLSTFIILSAVVGYKVNATSTSHVMYIIHFSTSCYFQQQIHSSFPFVVMWVATATFRPEAVSRLPYYSIDENNLHLVRDRIPTDTAQSAGRSSLSTSVGRASIAALIYWATVCTRNSSGDEIANVNFTQCAPEATRIR